MAAGQNYEVSHADRVGCMVGEEVRASRRAGRDRRHDVDDYQAATFADWGMSWVMDTVSLQRRRLSPLRQIAVGWIRSTEKATALWSSR